jgi:carbonic anhydrase
MLDGIADPEKRFEKLCELNVAEQVLNVSATTVVQDAWDQGRELAIHGWIYGIGDGLIRDLGIAITGHVEHRKLRDAFLLRDKREGSGQASN